ncbi:MAG: lipoate-protein ligase B, partial [Parvibaculum sp.]
MVKASPLTLSPTEEISSVEWDISDEPVPYEVALARMEARVNSIGEAKLQELVWLLEHPALYTAG